MQRSSLRRLPNDRHDATSKQAARLVDAKRGVARGPQNGGILANCFCMRLENYFASPSTPMQQSSLRCLPNDRHMPHADKKLDLLSKKVASQPQGLETTTSRSNDQIMGGLAEGCGEKKRVHVCAEVFACPVNDYCGKPAVVQVKLTTKNGTWQADVPSSSATGLSVPLEIRQKEVSTEISYINKKIAPKLVAK
ncbi:hypothetical protein M3Y96_00817000 [Aphelenchoides besseyi]|nr:hypothetical protein M3Y96_00817000 [Aphelenchoides besseyi]